MYKTVTANKIHYTQTHVSITENVSDLCEWFPE